MASHVHNKIQHCNKTLFALKTLKAHGMPIVELQHIFCATTLTSLLYAAPAWWGLTLAEDRIRLDAFLKRSIKAGFYPAIGATIEETVSNAEQRLFKAITSNPHHVLHPLLPLLTNQPYNLRPRNHSFILPIRKIALLDNNFITRMLYKNCY
jgi:hypothetical protein